MSTWLLPLLLLLAGIARALHDVGTHAPQQLARFGTFWDNDYSWKLKYKNGDPAQGPRFPGSTTWLVAFTDGWHLSNAVAWLCADAAIVLAAWPGAVRWWAVAAVVVRRVVFEPVYRWLRRLVVGLVFALLLSPAAHAQGPIQLHKGIYHYSYKEGRNTQRWLNRQRRRHQRQEKQEFAALRREHRRQQRYLQHHHGKG